MERLRRENTEFYEKDGTLVLTRGAEERYVLSHVGSGMNVQVDERTASKLMVLESLGETGKSRRLASRLMGEEVKEFRLDDALRMEIEGRINGQESGQEENRKTVLDAHVTGIGASGDFHLAARVRDDNSGEVHEVKGMITGLDAALLRSDTNEQGKDGTVLRNAQALASENFEKGMSAAFTPNNAMTMK